MSTEPHAPSGTEPTEAPTGDGATIAGDLRDPTAPIELVGDFNARFRVRAELARGGMGRVVVADDSVLRREVAIKELLHRTDVGLAARFEREVLLTARLQHPGIIGVYEFARHRDGTAALVMRRVRGRPFDEVIERAGSLEARLTLLGPFVSACDAVAYAHGEGVIHRDLKPANVLLGDFGDTVVIDWGLAKDLRGPGPSTESAPDVNAAKGADSTSGVDLTAIGSIMGTPAYMAPEQARGEPADARSDVYALGAMLYQLLCGDTPYGGKSSTDTLDAVRRGPPQPLIEREPTLPLDLVTLVARAMAREPADRFADAGALAAELKRFQAGQLVASHRYSTRDLVARWIRRHLAIVIVTVVSAVLLLGFGGVAFYRITGEKRRAESAAVEASWANRFFIEMFEPHASTETSRSEVSARELLDRGVTELDARRDREVTDNPLAVAQVSRSLGKAYENLGLDDKAHPLLAHALELRSRTLPLSNEDRLQSMTDVGRSLWRLGQLADAEKVLRDALAIETQRGLLETRVAASTSSELAHTLFRGSRLTEAEAEARAALAHWSKNDELHLRHLGDLADALEGQKRYEEALRYRRQILDGYAGQAARGERGNYRFLVGAKLNVAAELYNLHRYDEAQRIETDVSMELEMVLGPNHPDTLTAWSNVANNLTAHKQFAEGEALHRKVLAARRRIAGDHAPATRVELYNLSCTLALEGKTAEATAKLTEAVEGGLPNGIDFTKDDDLASLHGTPGYEALVARRKKH